MTLAYPARKIWNRESYYRLADSGALAEGERVELIEGEIIAMSPQNYLHSYTIGTLTNELVRLFGGSHIVRAQLPLDLGPFSQPEPDFALVTFAAHENSRPHPNFADLVIEVSDSSLSFDRNDKTGVYAKAGIPEMWIFNLIERQVEVFRRPELTDPQNPLQFRYHESFVVKGGPLAPLFAPESALLVERYFAAE